MHLLFDTVTYAWLGDVRESKGAIIGANFTPAGRKRLTFLWETWEREGIEVIKSITRREDEERKTIFVREYIPFRMGEAFQALVTTAPQHGYFVCSLDAKRSSYWNHLVRWPISDAMKFEMIFMAKSVPSEGLSVWDKEWRLLDRSLAAA